MKIAVLDDYQEVAAGLADWKSLGGDVTVFNDHIADVEALVRRLAPFEIICCMRERTPFPASLLARLPNLKLLVTTGARNLSIDVAAASARGVTVCGTGGGASTEHQMTEFTWSLILALVRHIPAEDRGMRQGGWQTTLGTTLAGKTLGLVGVGRIGADVARIGRAFAMKTIAWSPNLTPERASKAEVDLVSKQDLFRQADIVTVHMVLSDRSRGIVGADDLRLMKPTAYLINTSRGPLVVEAALLDCLRNKRIAGAALDVYDREPLPADHPLRRLDNVVITPHIGFVTNEAYRTFYRDTVEDVRAFLDGKPIRVLK
ncbi:MAG TPA: D-2-hydroxyacid dehydrogenase family protein [Candidatus Cybelea sp.]|nr:D-2-hydroxyacid dehydrogenase family protein [Candidatus Cybelea sp.]